MEKTEFVVAEPGGWWLVTPEYYVIEEPRKEVGEALGFYDLQWYLQVDKLEELHRQLEANHRQLLTDLDNALDDARRLEWLTSVRQAFKPDVAEAPAQAETVEQAAPPAPPPPSSSPSPFAKKSAFAKKEPESAPSSAAEVKLEDAVKEVVTDFGSPTELASELGMSETELQEILNDLPADFESRVAAEAARLAQG
jgi:hypothetical protein